MAFQRLGEIARVRFANVKHGVRAPVADDVSAGQVAQFVDPCGEIAVAVARRAVAQAFHAAPPCCLRSNAASTLGQWNRTRLPPGSRTLGILPVSRQAKSVRRETGRRFSSSFSSMKPAPVGVARSDAIAIMPAGYRGQRFGKRTARLRHNPVFGFVEKSGFPIF